MRRRLVRNDAFYLNYPYQRSSSSHFFTIPESTHFSNNFSLFRFSTRYVEVFYCWGKNANINVCHNTEKDILQSPRNEIHTYKISWNFLVRFVDSGSRKTCNELVKRQRRSTTDPDASGDSHFHQRPQKYKRPTSRDSKPWFEQYGSRPRAMLDSLRSKELQRMVEDLKVVLFQINIFCRRQLTQNRMTVFVKFNQELHILFWNSNTQVS